MKRNLTWLSDTEWAWIEPLLPRGRKGAHRVDDRRVISGIVHMLKSGARWRDCPPDYGPYTTVYNRFIVDLMPSAPASAYGRSSSSVIRPKKASDTVAKVVDVAPHG